MILKSISLNERSFKVNLLHNALAILGLPVTQSEVAKGTAGKDTLKQVRALQAQLNVPVDESTLVDDATARAIVDLLEKRGLTAATRSFTVSGSVRLPNRQVKKRQQLVAFDLDLRAVAVYRVVKNVEVIRKNGGFEFLGETVSDERGSYRITFYDWQYAQAERKKADVVVFAVDEEEIIGRSRIVNSENYSDKGTVSDLDVLITKEETRTEYEILMNALNAFLKESETSLHEIATSSDQLVFTAGELDVDLLHLVLAASAELLAEEKEREKRLSHELLYGIGRQNITLSWTALYKKQEEELRRAITKSVEERIIHEHSDRDINTFLKRLRESSEKHLLDDTKRDDRDTLNAMLSTALPEEKLRVSFLDALRSFNGSDFREFWKQHLPAQPEFKDKPELIDRLLLTQQLTLLTGNHQALVNELQATRKVTSMRQLVELEKRDWIEIVKKTGVPNSIQGQNDDEKVSKYADLMQGLLNAALPTQRIARMLESRQLPVEKTQVAEAIHTFLSKTADFDIASSRVHQFDNQMRAAAGNNFQEVRSELMKIQRVFQVSPSPEAMTALLENNLNSAYTIANIPRKSFIKTYSQALGGERVAFAVHQRASHISTRSEMAATHMMEYSQGLIPLSIMGQSQYAEAVANIENHVPNYAELFGSPDICECEHCRSLYSPAAYFVDLLRFLWRGQANGNGLTPLDLLTARRPDLLHLRLTCENTTTIIPYIDLANEVMEYYTAIGSLSSFEGHDTGEATAEELRANPQNFNLEAYRKLKDAKFPFTLPYHQPLDVIRTYSDHLNVSRYDALKSVNPQPDSMTKRAIQAESLALCQEEYTILTGEAFDGTADATALHEYFGYSAPQDLDAASGVREFLRTTGVAYTDLVELVKTRFINPHQGTLDFLQKLFSYASIDAADLYSRLGQVEAGTLDPAQDADIVAALNAYNSATGTDVTTTNFAQWVTDHLSEFRQVITLYQQQSKCDLDTTSLKTIQRIYDGSSDSGISNATWSRIHRFIRLWRKLGWTIHEVDLLLAALGENDLTSETISKLESVSLLEAATKLPLNQLAVSWGNIDTYGDKSLYKKLFLNKAVQQIDDAFKADAWGNYLQGETEWLRDHQVAILAAFRITQEDLIAILQASEVIDGGNARPLNIDSDVLNLQNLSTIYRYAVLAKGLKMRVPDLCRLIRLFGASPFSKWDLQQENFTNVSPADTHSFHKLAASTKEAGFKASTLDYILEGKLGADSTIGISRDEVLRVAKDIRGAFTAIEQDHPQPPEAPLTVASLTAELSLTFKPEIVGEFMRIVEGTASFKAVTDANLNVTVPDDPAGKYTYIKGSGWLICAGVMSDTERAALKDQASPNANFNAAVDQLYAAPETFISSNFNGVFADLDEANQTLLNRTQTPTTLDQKLVYIYQRFLPVIKSKLRHDAITRYLAALIGLTEESTVLLIVDDIEALIASLSTEGWSATYFSDAAWGAVAQERTDSTIDFSWGTSAPDPLVPADNFSVRWEAYIAAPASGEYTIVVETAESDEAFNLYVDEKLILQKTTANTSTSWEVVTNLNAARMHHLKLEYAEATQNAGVRLKWKTATSALEIVPASVAYPVAILNDLVDVVTLFHRAAKFVAGFKLSETELNHFITFNVDFGNINFKDLKASHWERIRDYATLRNAAPQARALLTDVFVLANTPNPAPTIDDLRAKLHQATAWDDASLAFLINTHFELTVDDFKNEISLNRIHEVMKIIAKTSIAAETIAGWGAAETDLDPLNDIAQMVKNAVKAKYEHEDWLGVAGGLSDRIRGHQKQALVSYLLRQPAIQAWGAEDADGLFEYFLIDVQMGSCMDTSRIVQANSSVQMFVNRCLLNLESKISNSSQLGVSPGAIDKDRWEWMKTYRVWEANRKVFLYPENWLEPEWRNNRSEFFKELESYLVQNDITDRTVEQAFRNYLTSLNEVANVEVCGMHREDYDSHKLKYLHVFARTPNAPYKFFYRRWNEHRKWSAWERVPLDIRCAEDGDNSGVHLIPVVWKRRLFLFWPEFIEKQAAPEGNSGNSAKGLSEIPMNELAAKKYWEIRLGWSEYVEGKWSPKQLSKEFVALSPDDYFKAPKDLLFTAAASDQELQISISDAYRDLASFIFSDIQTAPLAVRTFKLAPRNPFSWLGMPLDLFDPPVESPGPGYKYRFSHRTWSSTLQLFDDTYLNKSRYHKLLPVDTQKGADITLDSPFFYSDIYRNYFVRPVSITVAAAMKNIGAYKPYIPKSRPMSMLSGDVPKVISTSMELGSKSSGGKMAHVGPAFGNMDQAVAAESLATHLTDTGLEFHSFYHPFSSKYVTRLNQGGMQALMGSDTEDPSADDAIKSDEGHRFEETYQPNFNQGLVKRHSDFETPTDSRTAYKENVCFDVYGANSLYNWELFFHAPLYVATRLSKNGRFEEAMKWFHYIFAPITDEEPEPGNETARYWKVAPFKTTPSQSLEDWFRSLSANTDPTTENSIISEWRDNPFDPHLVASNRPLAYMKHVVVKYVENLIAFGDFRFRLDTMESINDALQIYVIANRILGPRPEFILKRGEVRAESYSSLLDKWDDFSNTLVEMENIFPFSSEVTSDESSTGNSLLGVGSALYFCIPPNTKLLELWDTVADRLFKIRHCQNIEGVERKLALFAPPISPEALIQAASQGLSLGSILDDLSSPPPIYRFTYLIQKANEFCAEVKALGSALLAAVEKKEAEELSRTRAAHETQMLQLMTAIKERQLLDAKARKESLEKVRKTASFRLQHYLDLLGHDSVTIPPAPAVSPTLTADSSLPPDTSIVTIETDVDESLVDSDESGIKLIPKEKAELDRSWSSMSMRQHALQIEGLAGLMNFIPNFSTEFEPFGVGGSISFGGSNLGGGISGLAKVPQAIADVMTHQATVAAKVAAYIRREQEWTLQANLAAREITQLDKQITSADIQIQVAEKDLNNHHQQIKNAEQVELFLKDKFTSQELYQWMKEQLFAVYKQSYNLAYDMAKKAEKAYKFELGKEIASFIQYGYWDNSKQGLVAGEKLQLALRQLEKSYLEANRRELELTKSVSLVLLNPLALIELRETGKCFVSLPEELFDLDFLGHYFRRIKSVSLSIPCVVGPYTTLSCSLRLLKNTVRINTAMNNEGAYEHENDDGLWIDDDRFRTANVPVTSIATSTGQNDAGMFELNFRDERYLPFEGAGVISEWLIELSTVKELRQFDYSAISDVILHLKYTARESGGLKEKATTYIKDFLTNVADLSDQPLMRMFGMRHEFPSEWHRFLHPTTEGQEQVLSFTIGKERFPFFVQERPIDVMKIEVFAKCGQADDYHLILSYISHDEGAVTSSPITMSPNPIYEGLNQATINVNDAGLNLEELDITKAISLKLKHSGVSDFTSLATNEVADIFLIVHYKLGEES